MAEPSWTNWSPWAVSPSNHQYLVCYRMNNATQEYEYQYQPVASTPPQANATIPDGYETQSSPLSGASGSPAHDQYMPGNTGTNLGYNQQAGYVQQNPQSGYVQQAGHTQQFAGYTAQPGQPQQSGYGQQAGNAHASSSRYSPPALRQTPESVGAPPSGLQITQEITPSGSEPPPALDRNHEFEKANPKYFKPGVVFVVLWTEPAGDTHRPGMQHAFSVLAAGNRVFTERRRFVVVRRVNNYHSSCVPISTYGYRGAVDRPDMAYHSIVFSRSGAEPAPFSGEIFNNYAMPVDVLGDQQLHPASRINYSKTYTVEHNVQIKKLGKVQREFTPYLVEYWKQASGFGAEET
ncbi:hypothetical protein FKW77_009164 [Venturia effusa]|uniref:DUF6590 domain-containing protein n=1 Tax=Venturia effusa TaxID=50376 RepID=A0A517L1X6_9PEZI|nr:hypothetical protein FKW77_009164 [Venturia effusa]